MKCSDMLPKIEIDQKAETVVELRKEIPFWGKDKVQRFANDQVADGKWERVLKHNGTRLVPAYRPKKRR